MDDDRASSNEHVADNLADTADILERMGLTEGAINLEDAAIQLYGKAMFGPDSPGSPDVPPDPSEPPDDESPVSMRLPDQ